MSTVSKRCVPCREDLPYSSRLWPGTRSCPAKARVCHSSPPSYQCGPDAGSNVEALKERSIRIMGWIKIKNKKKLFIWAPTETHHLWRSCKSHTGSAAPPLWTACMDTCRPCNGCSGLAPPLRGPPGMEASDKRCDERRERSLVQ